MVQAHVRARRSVARLGAVALLLIVIPGCGGTTDAQGQEPASTGVSDLESLVRTLPETTESIRAIDAVAAGEALGADRTALGNATDIPPLYGEDGDGPDPTSQLGLSLSVIIGPLLDDAGNAHEIIDLGQVTGTIAATMETGAALIIVATAQDDDELVAAYTDAGYEAGDDVLVLPGAGSGDDVSGGFPVVSIRGGLLVLAASSDALDEWEAATGPPDDVVTLLEAAGEYAAIHVLLPPLGAASCDALAIVDDGVTDELLIVDGGDDRFDRGQEGVLGFEVGAARPDEQVSRYQLTVGDPAFATLITGNVLRDVGPLTSC